MLELIYFNNVIKIDKIMLDIIMCILFCEGNGRMDFMKSNKIYVVRIDFMVGCLMFVFVDDFWFLFVFVDDFWVLSKGGGVNWFLFVMYRRFWWF